MKFLLINSNKIKISLSKEEIIEYSGDALTQDYELSKGAIADILAVAKNEVGFISSGYRLLIQFYPLGEGGELFVTRLVGLSESKERLLHTASNLTLIEPTTKIFLFNNVKELVTVISIFHKLLSILECSLFYENDVGYYLIIRDKISEYKQINSIIEYAREVPVTLISYIEEHARKIAEGEELLSLRQLF